MEISGLALSIAPNVIPTNTDELGMWLELGFSMRDTFAVDLCLLSSFYDRFTVLQYEWEFKVCMYVCMYIQRNLNNGHHWDQNIVLISEVSLFQG